MEALGAGGWDRWQGLTFVCGQRVTKCSIESATVMSAPDIGSAESAQGMFEHVCFMVIAQSIPKLEEVAVAA